MLVASVLVGATTTAPAAADVRTAAGNDLRTGWYDDQPGLGPSSVNASDFGQLFSTPVNGQVYAQPIVHEGTVLVVTETNDIYGLDPATGAITWTRNVGVPWKAADLNCGDLSPNIGITGTPVVDPATDTAYFFSKTYASGTSGAAAWYAHAVDVATGVERAGFPVAIAGQADNTPGVQFGATNQMQRPGLLLMDGVVYSAWGGHCDVSPYQGWVIGVSTQGDITTLWSSVGSSGEGSGFWQAGGGIVSDRPGSMIVTSGNGDILGGATSGSAAPDTNYGEAVVRLDVQPDGTLDVGDFFMPYDAEYLNSFDGDLGSSAPVALPSQYFGTPGHPNLMVQSGKEGYVYLLDRDHLGGYKQGSAGGDDVVARVGPDGGVWAKATPWGGDGGYVYVPTASPGPQPFGSGGVFHAYKYGVDGTGKPTLTLVGTSSDSFGYGSGSAVVTSDGATSGSAVVWTVWQPGPNQPGAQLRAYNPVPVNGTMQLLRSFPIGIATKFSVPAVSDNRLYVGTFDGHVLGFGRPVNAVFTGGSVAFPPTVVGTTANGTATFTAAQATTVTSAAISGNAAYSIAGPSTPPAGTAIAAGQTVTYPLNYTPATVGNHAGTLTLTTPQGIAVSGLSGTGQSATPLLVANPTGVSFGGIATGATRTASITLSNAGAQPLTLGTPDLPAAPFGVTGLPASGTQLAPGATVSVTLDFSPTAVGDFAGELVVRSDGGTKTIPLTGTAGTPAHLQVSATAIDFGSVPVNGAVDRFLTVTNTGGTDLTITRSKPPITGGFSAITALPEGSRIRAGESIVLKIRFNPTVAGPATSYWELNGDGTSTLTTVNLSGSATPNTIIPSPTAGGWLFNGSATQQGNTTVLTPATQYQAGTAFWPQSVDPSTVRVSFDLTIDQMGVAGADGATFAMVPANSSTEGTGTDGGGIGWAGLGGVAVVFSTYNRNTVDLRDSTGVKLSTSQIPALKGATNHVDIVMATNNVRVSINGAQVLNATITLPPLARVGFTAGTGYYFERHAVSNIVFNGQTTTLTANPSPVNFGSVTTGQSASRNVTVTNAGSSSVTVTGRTTPAAPFTATLPAVGTVLAGGASLTVPVTFSPTAASSSSSSFGLTTSGGTISVPLNGTGVSPTSTVLPNPWSGTGWQLNGVAAVVGSTVVLTPNSANVAGNALTSGTYAFDGLRASFDVTIDQGTGADGACFALVPASTPATRLGSVGGGMGWAGTGGTAVCLDTYKNGTEPSSNFVGLRNDTGYTATSTAIPSMRNTTTRVDVAVTGTNITVKVAGVQVLSGTINVTSGRLLFGAGTGGLTDRHVISNASLSIGTTPAPQLTVTPTSVAFGSVVVGSSATSNVTVANTGTATMTISSMTAPSAPFSATMPANGTTIAAGASITVPVTYAPAAAGAASGSLAFVTNGGSQTVSLSGTGTAAPTPVLAVSPATVAFGNVVVGQTANASVTVSNTGSAPLTISSSTAPTAPFAGTMPVNGTVIAAGASVSVPVSFTPTATGAASGSLSITSDGGSKTVNLTGTGTPPPAPVLVVTPTSVAFGNVAVGQTATSSVTVSNTGNAPLTISSTTAPAAPFAATMPANGTTVAAGASITVPVSFTPTALGAASGSLSFVTNAGNQLVSLSGTGTNGVAVPAPYSGTGWQLNGVAAVSGSSVILTPNSTNVAGNVVTTSTYSFASLSVAFDLRIDQGNGADGACFGMVPGTTAATTLGTKGGGMGWAGMGGTAICFDTYKNNPEPSSNFVGLRTDAGYGATSTAIPALRENTVQVLVTVTGTSIVVKVNGTQVLTGTLTTATSGRLMFGAATGGKTDRHTISNVTITA